MTSGESQRASRPRAASRCDGGGRERAVGGEDRAVGTSARFRRHVPKPGTVGAVRLGREHPLDCFVYVPSRVRSGAPALVAVHGLSRNARDHVEAFAPYAEEEGIVLAAPRFHAKRYRDYQRLGRNGRGERADRALDGAIAALAADLPIRADAALLFGYSGGAQFAHRYLMAHPERVVAAVCAGAGWYTFPDPLRRYPYGLRLSRELPGVRFRSRGFGRVPTLVIVGSEDLGRDDNLRRSRSLDRQQGADRVERGRRWCEAMNRTARPGAPPFVEFEVLEGAGHGFEQSVEAGLVRRSAGFLRAHSRPRGRSAPGADAPEPRTS